MDERTKSYGNFFKTLDVTNLIKVNKRKNMKFNMLLDYCIGKAAVSIKEFYILPVGDKLMQYDTIAVNTIVKNKDGEVSSCDILYVEDLDTYNKEYLKYNSQVVESCQDRELSTDSMVIGTSSIIDTEIDGAVGKTNSNFKLIDKNCDLYQVANSSCLNANTSWWLSFHLQFKINCE